MKWHPYPQYRDSGIEWLGEIPEHWEVIAFKWLGNFQAGAGFPDNEQGLTDEELPFYKVSDTNLNGNEVFMVEHNNSISRDTAARLRAFVFPPDTIVFAKVGAALLLNKRRILVRESCIDNNMMGFMPKTCDVKWAYYWMCGLDLGELANPGAVPSVNEGQLRDIPVPVPPRDEQRAIAAFLDRETARIDALIEKKQRQSELLQEKRAAVISHAVSKGLDPTVKMKDSGIEWLGEIPEHWEIWKVTHGFRQIGSGTTPKSDDLTYYEGDIPWVTTSELREKDIHDTSSKVTKAALKDYSSLKLYPPGTLLIAMYGATIGRLGILAIPACVNQACCAFAKPTVFETRFFFYWLIYRRPILISLSAGGGQPNLSQEDLKMLRVPLPPLDEQRAIAAFLDRETARIDALIEKIKKSIDLLREYRTALITAAVTGKIDVREEVPDAK